MADVFSNYDSLISNLSVANDAEEAKTAALHASKGKIDDMAKTVGDAKSLFGMHEIGTTFRGAFKAKAKEKFQEAYQKMSDKIKEVTDGARDTDEIASDTNDILAKGTERLGKFANKVKTGESSAFEDAEEGVDNPLRQTKSEFTDEDMGEENVANDRYNIENGLTDAEEETVENNTSQIASAAGRTGQITDETLNASRVGSAEGTISDTLNAAKEGGTDALKAAGETISKQVAKEAVGEAVGESISAGLDAIPVLDIVGVIGGAILAGVMGHKEKKETEEEGESTPTGAQVTSQIGV